MGVGYKILLAEIDNVIKNDDGRIKHRFLDLFHNRPSAVNAKVGFPTKDFPKVCHETNLPVLFT